MSEPVHPLEALRSDGLLWLINTTVFHPRGFALGLNYNETGEINGWVFLGDGFEPWRFEDDPSTNECFHAAERFLASHRKES